MNNNELYAIADILQMELHIDDRTMTGSDTTRVLELGDASLPMDFRVITSYAPFSGAAAVVRIMGDLGLCVMAEGNVRKITRTMHVLDLSKLPDRGERLIENAPSKPNNLITIKLMLLSGIVQSFIKVPGGAWAHGG